ncbi:Uncharacterized protein Adt_35997 [Abeliophyllum distichum]|uniref:Uncharacterized protein n=1 Tax=Abeliophyllum distichum TaxID=126358 RepID=A0ABD1QGM4_9LAMI
MRRQRKRRAGVEEEFIGHSQSKSYVRRKGQVTMTCSVCSLKGHNSRYHLRPDASDNGKMVSKRGNRCSSSQGEVLQSSFRFMPTSLVSHLCAVEWIIIGPFVSMPTNVAIAVITQEVNISSTVEEVATQRDERARKRSMRNIIEAPTNTSSE